ncbi:MAG: CotH kinase family protein [Crocinitomicaceae bacterium]|nr:CotH kinase family protein [Crocinitomicaceae bacterium]
MLSKKIIKITALSLGLFLSGNALSQIVINEYSCSNSNGPTDAFGEQEDWVELYNATGGAIDISGYYLSDKSGNLTKWQVPAGVSVPAGGYTMVFGSKRDQVSGAELHPSFSWTQTKGEWIVLANDLGNVVDSIKIVHMTKEDHSVGRSTDGAADWKLFTAPTPNGQNMGAQPFYTPTPVMDLAPGFYTGTQTVTITCAEVGATIRYTLDGSTPNGSSTVYAGPITISSTTVVRAFADGANQPSFNETNTYFIDVTHPIPVVSVCSDEIYDLIANGNGWGGNRIGSFELWEMDGTFIDEGEGDFNKHGNDSWAYDQRGFDVIMRDQFGYNGDIEHQIFPEKSRTDFQRLIMKPAANDNYPFEDGAHIRDAFVHMLSIHADMKLDERTSRACVLYLNGQYWGAYEMREKVDDHDYTDYYYGQGKFDLQFLKTWGGTWSEYGGAQAQTDWDDLVAYILANDISIPANYEYVDSTLNWRSLCDYFMFNSYIVSQDWLNWNTAWWRGMDQTATKKKWRYILWDMDASFGHYVNYTGIPDPSANADPCNVEGLPNPGGQGHTDILVKLMADTAIVEQYYITRYIDLINNEFSCEYMNFLLDSMINEIDPEMGDQIATWGGTYANWQGAVQTLRDFIDERCIAMETGLVNCYDLTGPFDITFVSDPPGAGEIKVNSIWQDNLPWTASYYGQIQTNTIARPFTGYEFDYWSYTTGPMLSPDIEDTNGIMITGPETITAHFRAVGSPPGASSDGVHVPTGFSPNGDGQNEVFSILVGADVESFTFYVYDRWGNRIVHAKNDPAFTWDGTFNGEAVNSGVYPYMYEVTYTDGTSEWHSGNITVIR